MPKLLVVYGTKEGQTAKIAGRIAELARGAGFEVELLDTAAAPTESETLDGIVVGASIHMGQYDGRLREWVKAHRAQLDRVPSCFYSVSITSSILGRDHEATVQQYVASFVKETGWRPRRIGLFGGALRYTKYGLLKRLMMRRVAMRAGLPTDTSRDYEFTDMAAVRRFADEFLACVKQ